FSHEVVHGTPGRLYGRRCVEERALGRRRQIVRRGDGINEACGSAPDVAGDFARGIGRSKSRRQYSRYDGVVRDTVFGSGFPALRVDSGVAVIDHSVVNDPDAPLKIAPSIVLR